MLVDKNNEFAAKTTIAAYYKTYEKIKNLSIEKGYTMLATTEYLIELGFQQFEKIQQDKNLKANEIITLNEPPKSIKKETKTKTTKNKKEVK